MNKERSFVYIGASLLVAIVVLLFLARPAYVAMLESKDTLSELREEQATKDQELADLKALIADYASTPQDQIQDLNEHIPDFTNQADIIAALEAMGKNSRALVTSIRFSEGTKSVVGKTIYPLDVTVVVTGSYGQLKEFISSLEQSKRIFNMSSTAFSSVSNTLTASINFTAYYSNIDKPAETTTPVTTSESNLSQ